MKQEAKRSGKKWIWIIAGLVLLLAIVGIVLAMVLGGGQSRIPAEGRADLYWNIDRLTYLKNSTTGQTSRQPAEDGMYYVRFAYDGEQVELPVADKVLVNYIDTMDVMGLTVDNDGVVVDAVPADEAAKEIGAPLYVQRTSTNLIIANTASALNSVSVELTITENTQIYDVTPEAEKIGAICQVGDVGTSDMLYVYANGSDEITHIYIASHPVRSPIYWAAERMYSSANKGTTRDPDENGIYTVVAYSEGEEIALKFKDKELVNVIDKKNKYSLHFGVTLDQNGFVMQVLGSDEALGGTIAADRYFVTEVNGASIKLQKFGSSPKEYLFNLPEDCPIYEVSKTALAEGRQGKQIEALEYGDRVTLWVDGNGAPILIYVSNSLVENVPVFYSPERKYSSSRASTTREPNSEGYYEIELYKTGDDGLTMYKCKDKALVDYLDSISVRILGLVVNEDNEILRVYDPECIFGYTQFTTGRTVDSIIGPFVTAITIGKPMDTLNAAMSTACEVYNVSGYGEYGRTMLQEGDHIVAQRGFDGYADSDIMRVYISRRLLGEDMMYFILDHSWDSTAKQSTREPDEDGWYRVSVAHNGQQMVVRTRSKAMIDKMESFAPGAVCLELDGDVVVGAYDPVWGTGGKKATSGYRIVSFNEDGTLTANLRTTYTDLKIADDCVYYNVSDAVYSHRGEVTSYLQMGDMITAFTNRHGEATVIYVRGRETKGMYWNTQQMYDSKTKLTTRTPDADGWYYFDLACNGVVKTYKTKDLELASKVDSYATGFGLVVEGNVIRGCVAATWVDDVSSTAAANWDVVGVDGNTITIQYNLPGSTKTGTTTTLKMHSGTKVYDVSLTAEKFGAPAKIKVGDRIRAYGSEDYTGRLSYVYIMTHDTRAEGQTAYCEHCDKVVFWNPWRGENFSKGDAHYYLNADLETNKQISIYSEELQYEVVLDLNGNTYNVVGKRGFAVYRGETMTVMDSVGGGCLAATGASGGYGGVFTLVSEGTLNLLSGTIKGVESEQNIVYGGTIYATGNINIYGGEIIGGVTKADTTLNKTTAYGGAIMGSGATINMYGGKISGGKAENYEYTVIDEKTGEETAKVNDGRGGNVYITGGTFNMYGGEIVGGNASHGGNIYVSNSTFNMAGGKISGGVATNGGNAYVYNKGNLVTSGDALITGGVSTRATSRNNGGGNVFVYINGTVLMEGGSITDGTAVSYGGNITCRGGNLVIRDGIISGGKSETEGDNVYINGTAGAGTMMVAAGGQIVNGSVYIHKPAEEGRINLGLTGAPVIEELDLTSGAIFEMYELAKGANVTVNGAGTLSAPYEKAQAYVDAGYIKHVNANSIIKAAEDNTLYVAMYCEHCDDEVQWINWNGEMLNTADVVDGGHYLLMKDINTSSQIRIGADAVADDPETADVNEAADAVVVNVCIDLNGHSITNKARAFAVYAGSTLNLVNSSETESIVTGAYNRDVGGVINLGGESNLNLYDNISLVSSAEEFTSRGGIVNLGSGTFNMYGGTINGRQAASGGAVYVGGGTFNMMDGTITGGTATSAGGNIYLNGGELNISGGLIENGFADNSNGGNIYMTKGTLNISGDAVITGGKAIRSAARTNGGGNIYGQDNTVININGGTIMGGETNSFGGNVLCRGTLTVTDGVISGGTAVNGGNVFINGYNVEASFTMTGGTIENGTATTGQLDNPKLMVKEAYDGDNIYATSATVNISGGSINDNDGGNAVLAVTSNAERPAFVNLTVAENAALAAALDNKVYLVSGAELISDLGGLKIDADGDKLWCIEGYDVEAPDETTAPTEPDNTCPHCGETAEWTEWTGGSLNTAAANGGHYILTKDVNTSSQIRIGADAVKDNAETAENEAADAVVVTVCIDLNGHSITGKGRAFAVYAGSTLNLMNKGTQESVITGAYTADVGGVINLGGESNLNLYDNISLSSSAEEFTRRGGIVHVNTGTFNMYGGTINGRAAASGGAVYVNGGTFNVMGGTITGGTATNAGGNIYLNGGELNISGGVIENGFADNSNGGNIYMAKGELNVSGDAIITGGTAIRSAARTNGGGNIYGQDKTVINISGGQILNGETNSFGGNVYGRGTVTISGGVISGGTAVNGGNVFVSGYSYADASLTVTGGTIENGTATTGELCNKKLMVKEAYDGDNIYATSATVNISGGEINDNDGGNAVLAFTSKQDRPAVVNLAVAENAALAAALDGKVYLVSGAVWSVDQGGMKLDTDGDAVWCLEGYDVQEPTEPSAPTTEPTDPSTPVVSEGECPHCGEVVQWTEWTGSSLNKAAANGGHYILTKDVSSSGQIRIGADAVEDDAETAENEAADAVVVTVCIDLNGYSINGKGRAFAVYAGSTLNLVNTSETESNITGAYNADVGGVINLGGASNLNLYEGISLASSAEEFTRRGGIVHVNTGTFNMYGGTINGQNAAYGGAVYVNGGAFNVEGGIINGATARYGGAVCVTNGAFTLTDGVINGGTAYYEAANPYGGAVYVNNSVFTMVGGTIIGGEANDVPYVVVDEETGEQETKYRNGCGGNVYIGGGSDVTIAGGQIIDGKATLGGNLYIVSSNVLMLGGEVADGEAGNGGNVYIGSNAKLSVYDDALITRGVSTKIKSRNNGGGNVFVYTGAKLEVDGGVISDGVATSYGGNIACRGGEFVMIDGSILRGKSEVNGDNVYVNGYSSSSDAAMVVSGGQILGGNVYVDEPDDESETRLFLTGVAKIENLELEAGALFMAIDMRDGANVAVSGTDAISFPSEHAQTYVDAGYIQAADPEACILSVGSDNVIYVHELRYCEHCDEMTVWTEWTGSQLNAAELNGGHYHYILTEDVTVSGQIRIGANAVEDDAETAENEAADAVVVNVCIDLDGHSITGKSRAFAVYAGSTLSLMNSGETESVITGAYTADVGGVINLGGASNLNLHENISLASSAEEFDKKGGIVNLGTGTFNMYGGTINGQTAAGGGAIYVTGGTFNMMGGTVTGGTSTNAGGNIYLNGGELNISGGVIENGFADNSNGGNIYMTKGELNVSGDAIIRNGRAIRSAARTNGGGNIYGQDKTVINISGGQILNGETNSFGGNVLCRGTLTVSGGLISGGTAVNGGNVFINGFSVEASFTMNGGTIENGTATTGQLDNPKLMVKEAYDGDNIFATSATVNISGGEINDNDGGNAVLAVTSNAERPAYVNIDVAENAALADVLDGKVYLVSGAELSVDLGAGVKDSDNDTVWYKDAVPTEPTDPVDPTEPSTEPTEPDVDPTEPSTEPSEPSTPADTKTECPHCGEEVEWTEWTGGYLNTAEVNGGHYVLNKEITSGGQIAIGANAVADDAETTDIDETAEAVVVEVCVDLNGYSITKTGRAFAVYAGSTLNLMNTAETESVITGSYNRDRGGVINLSGASNLNLYDNVKLVGAAAEDFAFVGGVVALAEGTFTMNGGTIVGQHATNGGAVYANGGSVIIAGGTINGGTATLGGAVYVNGGSLVISGGEILGGTATSETSDPYGGNVYVEGSDFAMTGGKISGGKVTSAAETPGGGNVYLRAGSAYTLTITGGIIENGVAENGNGGNVYLMVGTLNISGDVEITGGNATRAVARTNGGGNVYTATGTILNISGGKITNGVTNSYGGNVVVRGTALITDGLISGGTALNGGNIFINGYDRAVTCTISGGTIENGTATTGKIDRTDMVKEAYDGDNIYVNSAVLNITGGTITDNDGGNAALAYTHPNSVKDGKEFGAVINLVLTDKADLADALDGKVYIVSGSTLNADIGGTSTDADGDMVWYKVAPETESTEPGTQPSEETTAPTTPEETTTPTTPEETTTPTVPEETTTPTVPEDTTAPTEPEEKCPHCDVALSKLSWIEWTTVSGGTVTEGGHYYLTASVEGIKSQLRIGVAGESTPDVVVDLRGFSFTATNVRIFSVYTGSTLTVMDTVGGGELQGGGNGGNVVNLSAGATFNLYDATLTNVRATESTSMGGVVNTTDGDETSYSVFNMYSGTLNGGNHAGNGGAVCVRKYAEFNMYDGVINGAECATEGKSPTGAAVAIRAATSVARIYGGTINAGVSEGQGDCIYVVAGATFVVEGGQLLGGDVCVKTTGENAVVLSGAPVIDNLDLTAGGTITLGEGGVTGGSIAVTAAEGAISGANAELAESSAAFFSSTDSSLQVIVADGQLCLAAVQRSLRTVASAAIAGGLKAKAIG